MSPRGHHSPTTDYPDCYSIEHDENPARFIEYRLVGPLITGMTSLERVDYWLDVVHQHYPERDTLRRQLEHQRNQIVDDTVNAPAASTRATPSAEAVTDGGTTERGSDTNTAESSREPEKLEYPDDETFEHQKQQACSIATTFDSIDEVHDRLQDEGGREPTRPHVIAALNERLSELREREEDDE